LEKKLNEFFLFSGLFLRKRGRGCPQTRDGCAYGADFLLKLSENYQLWEYNSLATFADSDAAVLLDLRHTAATLAAVASTTLTIGKEGHPLTAGFAER